MKLHTVIKAAAVAAAAISLAFLSGCGDEKAGSSQQAVAGAKTYVVATRGTSRPFGYADDNGNLTGFEPELLRAIEKKDPSLHFEFKSMSVDAAFVAMDAGQVDLIANQMRRSPAREEKYLITNEPNNYSVRKLVVKKDRDDIHSLADLAGKKVAVTTNSEFKDMVDSFNAKSDNKIEEVFTDKGSAEVLNLIATGRVDAGGEYAYITESAVKDRGLPLKVVGDTLAVIPTYYIVKKDEAHKELITKLDAALKALRADGTLKAISEKYLGDDYSQKREK